MKIAMVASEVVPFAKTGGLADVAGALPMALEKIKHEVIIIMPKYKSINQPGNEAKIGKNIKVYFIENEKYFSRPGLYGEKTGDYPDNLERFSFFCKKALELMKKIKFQPDIIHCHDWQTSLVPVYLKTTLKNDPFFKKTRSVVTIHNIGYQGLFKKEEFPKLGLDWSLFGMNGLEFFDRINILKGGLVFSDVINTVSPTYSQEILDPKQGFGLEGILLEREERLFGILNGIDNDVWNPAEDKYLAKKFSAASLENKAACKEALQKDCKLAVKKDVPLFGFVGRLAEQKGFDLIDAAIERMSQLDMQFVILGTGDLKYHTMLEKMAARCPNFLSVNLKFDDAFAHRIYAGCDLFLMPSKYEPCGLGQLISYRYGTPVIVHKTGGLADTVSDYNALENSGSGFVFDTYTREGLMEAVLRAMLAYENKKKWQDLVTRDLKLDYSWDESAKKYIQMYKFASSIKE